MRDSVTLVPIIIIIIIIIMGSKKCYNNDGQASFER